MKHLGSKLEFTKHRNAELMKTFRRILGSAGHIFMPDVFRKVSESPTSRFWVSEERAAVVIKAIYEGRPLAKMRPNKEEMFREIFNRVEILRLSHPGLSVSEAVTEVVYQPAPKFYLTPRTVGELIYRIKQD